MRALLSLSDKTGLNDFARELHLAGFELVSTGGTAKSLRDAQIPTVEVSELTKFPEILGGRVKTLHPRVFGGILYDRKNSKHSGEIEAHGITPIDWVIVNLYPFEKMRMDNKLEQSEMIEFIDIGGVSLLRAAGKNFSSVTVLCDPADYGKALSELKENKKISLESRRALAAKAFAHCAHYDAMIARYFREEVLEDVAGLKSGVKISTPIQTDAATLFSDELTLGFKKVSDLRYGENPQQKAALYKESGSLEWGVVHAQKLQGKELSFNNYLDLDAAWNIVNSFAGSPYKGAACVIVKHNNPCGTAVSETLLSAFQLAVSCDPLSAFGGVIGFGSAVDKETAEEVTKSFYECVIAPDYAPEALEIFKKKPNLRLLRQGSALSLPYELDLKRVSGGLLVQEKDNLVSAEDKAVSKRPPTPEEAYSLGFAWRVCKFVKSNAIVLSQGSVALGVGAGQMSRIDSLKIALSKMSAAKPELLEVSSAKVLGLKPGLTKLPLVMASDAFFPFRDCVDEAAKAGISAIIQPGGSLKDQESIDAANQHGMAMMFTGMRHFKH